MNWELFFIKNRGFSIIEIIISVSIFLIFALSFFSIIISSSSQLREINNKERAIALAEEGLEAVRNIKENDFTNLVDGNHGLAVLNNEFHFLGQSDTTDIFEREINISTMENDFLFKKIESKVIWNNKSVSLIAYFTNWSEIIEEPPIIETCLDYCFYINYISGICRQAPVRCAQNNEIYESGGNEFCPGTGGENICCCKE